VFPGHPEHLRTFDYLGIYRYSLTFCTVQREHRFIDPGVVDLVRAQFLRAAAERGFTILAYCFMPDHVHLLIASQNENSDCKQFIARAKQYSGFYYARQFQEPLWQRYGFERVLRSDEATVVVARYILANPLRAGLVARVSDYPFLGSCVFSLDDMIEWIEERS
jgi:putative transposase